ncbi:hypothetical protein BJV77DRAFT_966052 [Russula vinacea]|nr:hypothetical protein BJV77DRAFT_966052 [Russula vinacea]
MNKQDGVRSGSDREKTPSRMATFKCTLVQTFCTVRLNYFNSQADGKKLIQFTSDEENVWRSMPELEIPLEIMAPAAFNLHSGTNLPYVSISQAEKGYFIQFTSGMEKRNHGTRCLQFAWWYKPSICNPFHKRNGKKVTEKMQSAQELEIPLGTIFSFLSCMLAKAKNPHRLSFLPIFFPSLLTSETDDDEDIASVTLPPSQYGWTVVMVKGILNQVCVVENRLGGRMLISQLSAHTDPNTTAVLDDASSTNPSSLAATTKIIGAGSASGSGDASTVAPVGLTIDVATIDFGMDALNLEGRGSPHERQTLNGPASHLRGFFMISARISPLVKLSKGKVISGAHWGKAEGQEDALKKWDAAVEEGIVERIAELF